MFESLSILFLRFTGVRIGEALTIRKTFNSLFEIHFVLDFLLLEVFVNFQFSFWDSYWLMSGWMCWLKRSFNSLFEIRLRALFRRKVKGRNFQFSFWDSLLRYFYCVFFTSVIFFQFSFWDSLLSVTFTWWWSKKISFNSLFEIRIEIMPVDKSWNNIYFQFSFWDSPSL